MAGCSQLGQDYCEPCRISSAPLNCGTSTDPGLDAGSGEAQPSGASLSSREGGDTVASAGGTWGWGLAHKTEMTETQLSLGDTATNGAAGSMNELGCYCLGLLAQGTLAALNSTRNQSICSSSLH